MRFMIVTRTRNECTYLSISIRKLSAKLTASVRASTGSEASRRLLKTLKKASSPNLANTDNLSY